MFISLTLPVGVLDLERSASQCLLFKDCNTTCGCSAEQSVHRTRGVSSSPHAPRQEYSQNGHRSPGSASFLQPLNRAVFRSSQPPLKASNENISLLPGEEDEARNRQRVSRQLQATLVGFEAWFSGHFHLSTATFVLQGQLLSSKYNITAGWRTLASCTTGSITAMHRNK